MIDHLLLEEVWEADEPAVAEATPAARRSWLVAIPAAMAVILRAIGSGMDWLFGMLSLLVGLSTLAALPVLQLLTLGYFLECSARVARTGRIRDGFVGVRKASRAGRLAVGLWLSTLPAWFVAGMAHSAELIAPGSRTALSWRIGAGLLVGLTTFHILSAIARGGRLRHFLWPFGHPFWLVRRLRAGGLYSELRESFWTAIDSLRLPYYFRLGLVGFVGTLAWLIVPAILIAAGGRFPPLGIAGLLLLAVVVPFLPFLQIRYALEGRISAMFARRAIRERFRRAPWSFAFSLMVLLLAAIPLYLLKVEMIPREAAWLPSLVFVTFLAPARLLNGWAFARSGRRDRPSHWFFRLLGRLAIIPVAAFYVLIVFLAQYTSWGGAAALYDQHAFLVPVPFLSM